MVKNLLTRRVGQAIPWMIMLFASLTFIAMNPSTTNAAGTEEGLSVNDEAYPAGDINGDGCVDNKDLTRLFQRLSDWDVQVVKANLDLNGDGEADNKDLTRLFQYLSDWDVELYGGGSIPDSPDSGGGNEEVAPVVVSTETVSFGQVAVLSCTVSGHDSINPDTGLPEGIVRIEWESSSDRGVTWSACANTGSDSMRMSVIATEKGVDILYRVKVTDTSDKTITSDSIKLVIDGMLVTVTTNEVEYGGTSVLASEVTNANGHSLGYQWQKSENAIDWDDIAGASGSTYSVTATVAASAVQYRCVVVDDAGRVSSSEAVQLAIKSTLPAVQVSAHVQDLAWLSYVGMGEIAGTTGRGLRLEAIKIKLTDGSGKGAVTYRVHSKGEGWGSWRSSDQVAGTTDKKLRAEAIEVKLTGEYANAYDVYYRVHVSDVGWIGWAKNGETAGSTGLGKAIEAIQVILVNKGEAFNVGGAYQLLKPSITYKAHVENSGWQSYVGENGIAGTTGEGLRMEALKIKMDDVYGSGNAVTYRAHVSDIGWMDWVPSGAVAGTTGEYRQMECVQVKLSGYASSFFDIYYRVHVEDLGWLGWAKNGELAGTTDGRKRMEAIIIKVVVKGTEIDREGESYRDLKSEPVVPAIQEGCWPLTVNHNVTRGFSGSHDGYDLATPAGTPVYASFSGTVYKSIDYYQNGKLASYGKFVVVQSQVGGKTIYCIYAHMNLRCVEQGESVRAGQLVGYSGSTGNSTGPHLHFEVREGSYYGGSIVSPGNYISQSKSPV